MTRKNDTETIKNDSRLLSKRCTPCTVGMPPLADDVLRKLLLELGQEWAVNEIGQIYREYKFDNFIQAMDFANEITEIAEQENHHPDLEIAWGKCVVKIWTHKIHGLTENDFILAAKLNTI